jgi:xylan 1,4-beta-xylosidase
MRLRAQSACFGICVRILAVPAQLQSAPPDVSGSEQSAFQIEIHVDAARQLGVLRPAWRFFGADEPNYAYMKDGKKLLAELGELRPGQVYFRTHNLLTSGGGTPALKWGSTGIYREDANKQPHYDWTIVDRIFSTYLEHGVRPYVQIGFMPEALSRRPKPYRHHWTPAARYEEIFTGWAHPPTDYGKWQELVYQWTRHCIDKFGRDEVAKWYWEVWNEANAGYWRGTPEEFFKLHDHAIAGVRRALPEAKVGGPDVAGHGGQFTRDFLRHCLSGTNYANGKKGTPLDFVSFHAKGQPEQVAGHVRMGISHQIRTIDEGFRIISSFPELKGTPVVIGECDPEGCAACQGPQLAYRNTTMYSSYTAASFARIYELARSHGINLEGILTWAFEFEDQPYFAGFRVLASNGIDLPVLNVFRMFARMSGQELAVRSSGSVATDRILAAGVRDRADVSAMAALDDRKLWVLAWHYHDDDVPGPTAEVTLTIDNLSARNGQPKLRRFDIDAEHSNAYTAWQRMGKPQEPTTEQYAELELRGRLAEVTAPDITSSDDAQISLSFQLPRQAVSLFEFEWPR